MRAASRIGAHQSQHDATRRADRIGQAKDSHKRPHHGDAFFRYSRSSTFAIAAPITTRGDAAANKGNLFAVARRLPGRKVQVRRESMTLINDANR